MKIEMTNKQIVEKIVGKSKNFPLYTSTFINYANRWSGGTKPNVVGQMSELTQECPFKSHEEWKEWYLENYPDAEDAIENAIDLIYSKFVQMKKNLEFVDKPLIKEWVEDFIYIKTFYGFKFQEAIIKKIAEDNGLDWRLATPEEESKNIDGFIGDKPVSVKPSTFDAMPTLNDEIDLRIISYEKKNGSILFEVYDLLDSL